MLTFTNKTKYVSSKPSNSITYCKVSAEVRGEASAGDNPVIIERASRLENVWRELEEKAQLQAAKEAEETTATAGKARGPSPSVPPSPKSLPLSNKAHPLYSPVTKASSPASAPLKSIIPSTEQAFLERIMEARGSNYVHSMVSVGNLPTLKESSLSAIETFSKEYFTTVASKTFNSANKSLHPIRGLSADNYKLLSLIWNGTKTTRALGLFASSDVVEPALWLRSLQEAVRVAQRAPKVDTKLELEKASNGSPKIEEYVVKLQRHFEHHSLLTIEKKLELVTKGLKKHFKTLGTFVEDTAIPEERGRCDREGECFSIETALFIVLKEFRSYMGSRQNLNSDSSDESASSQSSDETSSSYSSDESSDEESCDGKESTLHSSDESSDGESSDGKESTLHSSDESSDGESSDGKESNLHSSDESSDGESSEGKESNLHSSDESSDEEASGKKSKEHWRKRKLLNEKESGSKNSDSKHLKGKDKANPKDNGFLNTGDEIGKLKCYICKSEDHLMNECPDFDPNYKSSYKKPKGR